MLPLVEILIWDLNLQKQGRRVYFARRTRFFVLACLLQVGTIAGTVQRNFPLLTTTLRADPSMHRGAKALLFPDVANGATQSWILLKHYGTAGRIKRGVMKG